MCPNRTPAFELAQLVADVGDLLDPEDGLQVPTDPFVLVLAGDSVDIQLG